MKLILGKIIAGKILAVIKRKIKKSRVRSALAVILVGEDPASKLYISLKRKRAEEVGIGVQLHKFTKNSKEAEIIEKIKKLNADKKISGIIVQLPLPKKFSTEKIINSINPAKDVDGFNPKNKKLSPVFPTAIIKMLEATGVNLKNKKAVILANSEKFGKVMKDMLQKKGIAAGYILKNNIKKLKTADIIISAIGKPGFIKGEMIKKGAIIINGGITKKRKKVLGDVDFQSVKNKASFITPVPSGVGPVTIACLLENVYLAAKK